MLTLRLKPMKTVHLSTELDSTSDVPVSSCSRMEGDEGIFEQFPYLSLQDYAHLCKTRHNLSNHQICLNIHDMLDR